MVNSSVERVIINHYWFFRQATFKDWFIIEIWMVMDEFPFHLLLRIHFTVPLWVCSLTSRSTCHGITFINFPYCSPQDVFPAWVWLNVLLHCFVLSLGIVRMIYPFHSSVPVGLFAGHKLCPEFHAGVQMYRRLCFHMLASFHWSVLKRQVLFWWSVNKMNFPIRFARWLSLTRMA